jgi:hypothetical protein
MHARVTRAQTPADRLDQAIQGWRQMQQDVTVKQEGFRGNTLLVNRETGEWHRSYAVGSAVEVRV